MSPRSPALYAALTGLALLAGPALGYGPDQPPATDWHEVFATEDGHLSATQGSPEKEDQFFVQSAAFLRQVQAGAKQANGGVVRRAFHAKLHVGTGATLEVAAGIPSWARRGPWAEPGRSYPALVRWSNGQIVMGADQAGDVRGMAVKLLGTPGENLIADPLGESTQDFLCINRPNLPTRDIFQFMAVVKAAVEGGNIPWKLTKALGVKEAGLVMGSIARWQAHKVVSLAAEAYSSAAPIRFGDYAARIQLTPTATADGKPGDDPDYLRDDLVARLDAGDLVFHVDAQFFVNERKTPIEHARTVWEEEDAPLVRLGTLTVHQRPRQGAASDEQDAMVDGLAFSPWHAAPEFRPLGSQMRARRRAYLASQAGRGAR